MSDSVREALHTLRDNIRDEKGSVQRMGVRDNNDTRDAIATLLENEAALSANGGEAPTWAAEDEPVAYLTWHQVRHAIDDYEEVVALSHKDDRSADGTPAFPVYTHPAPPSVVVPENDNGVSSAYDSGYLDAMLYARVCCDRLDNPENTKDYRDCARFLDLIFKSEIDEAARLRTAGDEGEES